MTITSNDLFGTIVTSNSSTTGRKVDDYGDPLLLRDSHTASNLFGLDNARLNTIPQPKFLFYVKFLRHISGSTSSTTTSTSGSRIDWSTGLGFVIKKIERPSVTFTIETLNQYNKIRKVQTKHEHNDIGMSLHDTADLRVRLMFEEYFKYYYGDGSKMVPEAWTYDQTSPNMFDDGIGWGFQIDSSKTPNMAPFFSEIQIYQFVNKAYTVIRLINPYLLSYEPDELNYEEGSATQEIHLKLAYEGIIFNSQPTRNDIQSIFTETKLDMADYYEPDKDSYADQADYNSYVDMYPSSATPSINSLYTYKTASTASSSLNWHVTQNSALDTFGYFNFGGINVGTMLSNDGKLAGNISTPFGATSTNNIFSKNKYGGNQLMMYPPNMGTSTIGSAGSYSTLFNNSNPSFQGGLSSMYGKSASSTLDMFGSGSSNTGQNITWNNTSPSADTNTIGQNIQWNNPNNENVTVETLQNSDVSQFSNPQAGAITPVQNNITATNTIFTPSSTNGVSDYTASTNTTLFGGLSDDNSSIYS